MDPPPYNRLSSLMSCGSSIERAVDIVNSEILFHEIEKSCLSNTCKSGAFFEGLLKLRSIQIVSIKKAEKTPQYPDSERNHRRSTSKNPRARVVCSATTRAKTRPAHPRQMSGSQSIKNLARKWEKPSR